MIKDLLHLTVSESLSTERRQLLKVEADLKEKIINLFNGTCTCTFTSEEAVFTLGGFSYPKKS